MSSITVQSAAISEKGPIRHINADAVLADDDIQFFAVADGVGSDPSSPVASRCATIVARRAFERVLNDQNAPSASDLMRNVVREYREQFGEDRAGPKTTLSFGYFTQKHFHFTNVGDSPILLTDQHQISLLTARHTVVDSFRSFADFSEIKSLYGSNVLLSCLGCADDTPNQYEPILVSSHCRFLLASDGIFNFLSQRDLFEISHVSPTPDSYIARIFSTANASEPSDNYSLIVIDARPND